MADLIALGAPKLPEGFFYRIKEATDLLGGLVWVELRQDRKRFGSRYLHRVLVDPAEHETPEAAILFGCAHVHAKRERFLRDWERRDAVARFYGDHR